MLAAYELGCSGELIHAESEMALHAIFLTWGDEYTPVT